MKKLYSLALCAVVAAGPLAAATPEETKEAFIADLMERMTLEEKVGQLRLVSIGPDMPQARIVEEIAAGRIGGTFNSVTRHDNRPMQQAAVEKSRLKIPMFFAYDVVHGHRTVFPIGPGLASTWDMDAVELAARTMGREAAADGIDMTFAPMVDIARDPRWGRMSEGFGEDPFLVSEIARRMVRGLQGSSPANPDSVMAAVKHFALYGAVEGGRDYNTVDMSPMRMYQDYLPPYRAAIEAGAGGVMIALNAINGMPASADTWLLQDLLRRDWGFRGVTLSDHGAITELMNHGVARDGREAARLAIEAGVDMSMADQLYRDELPTLVKSGAVDEATIDNAVREVLGAKYDMGLFDDPFRRIGRAADDPADVNAESRLHRAEAREVARKSLVLLENRDGVLPLARRGTIALVGPLADTRIDMMGSWSAAGVAAQSVTLLDGLRAVAGPDVTIVHAPGANVTDDPKLVEYLNYLNWDKPEVVPDPRPAEAMIAEALEAARRADVVVAAVGESRGMSHESSSRTSLAIPESQRALIEALAETGKPLVLVLVNGRPLELNRERELADAILETWFAGTEGGHAIADVLFGDYNPAGKLPMSFPRSVGHIPAHYNHLRLGRPYQEDKPGNYTSQYFDAPNGPLYPFGYGLSYTSFEVSPVRLSAGEIARGGRLEASVTVRNTGERAGATVVQLYVHDVAASVVRPVKELKDFQRVELAPGESREVRFALDESDLAFFNARLEHVAEPGEFEVQIGLDSRAVQTARFELL